MKLIILNGPVGVGKTTLGKQLQEKLPLSFFFHFDEIRRHIGQYHDYPHESRNLAFELAFSCAEKCFEEGKDFIIDKIMYNKVENGTAKPTLDILYQIADKHKAEVFEFLLWADKVTVMNRLDQRGYKPHGLLTPEKAELFWEEMNKFKANRKQAIFVDTTQLSADEVFKKVFEMLP